MKILVVAATRTEIDPWLKLKTDADVCITGVGCAQSVFMLTQKLFGHKYDWVIQAGIAGSFRPAEFQMGDVVAVSQDCFADVGVWEKDGFVSIQEMGLEDKNVFPFHDGWLVNRHVVHAPVRHLPQVSGITVNAIFGSRQMNEAFAAKYNAAVESMEGAALHYVCNQLRQPYLQLRAVSNVVGERDKSRWDIPGAIQNLYAELDEVIKKLKQ